MEIKSEKMVTVLPIYMKEIEKVVEKVGNTQDVFETFINRFARTNKKKHPQWTNEQSITQAITMIENSYIALNLDVPYKERLAI